MARAVKEIYNPYMLMGAPQSLFDTDHAIVDGLIMLVLGFMFLMTTFKGDTRPMAPVWLWIGTAAGFSIAAFLIIEGGVLLLRSL
jgi:hypothetical protein